MLPEQRRAADGHLRIREADRAARHGHLAAQRMLDRGIAPEIEIFDLGMVNVLRYLQDRGLVTQPAYANLLFGNLSTAQADLFDIGAVVSRLPSDTIWSLAGLGAAQLPVAAMAAAAAPGVRIGLEDNLWLDLHRTRLACNLELVERVHALAALLDRRIMTPSEFRAACRMSVPGENVACRQATQA